MKQHHDDYIKTETAVVLQECRQSSASVTSLWTVAGTAAVGCITDKSATSILPQLLLQLFPSNVQWPALTRYASWALGQSPKHGGLLSKVQWLPMQSVSCPMLGTSTCLACVMPHMCTITYLDCTLKFLLKKTLLSGREHWSTDERKWTVNLFLPTQFQHTTNPSDKEGTTVGSFDQCDSMLEMCCMLDLCECDSSNVPGQAYMYAVSLMYVIVQVHYVPYIITGKLFISQRYLNMWDCATNLNTAQEQCAILKLSTHVWTLLNPWHVLTWCCTSQDGSHQWRI